MLRSFTETSKTGIQTLTLRLPSWNDFTNALILSVVSSSKSGLYFFMSPSKVIRRIVGNSSSLRPKYSKILPLASTPALMKTNRIWVWGDTNEEHHRSVGVNYTHTIRWSSLTIEGLHDAIRTYMRTILPRCLVSFCMARYREKQKQNKNKTKITLKLLIYFAEQFKISTKCVCCHSVIIWYCGMN